MKKNILKGILSATMLLVVFSCSEKEDGVTIPDTVEAQNVTEQNDEVFSKMINSNSAIDFIGQKITDSYEAINAGLIGRSATSNVLQDCLEVTVTELQDQEVEVVLDFGDGCDYDFYTIAGIIRYTYYVNDNDDEVSFTSVLEDFYFNDINIEGGEVILRELNNGQPRYTHNFDFTFNWFFGMQSSEYGLRINEWVEGFDTSTLSDNVFEVSGNWTSQHPFGFDYNFNVLNPLRFEVDCGQYVSGNFEVDRPLFDGVMDFGDGTCDDQAVFTFEDGNSITLYLF